MIRLLSRIYLILATLALIGFITITVVNFTDQRNKNILDTQKIAQSLAVNITKDLKSYNGLFTLEKKEQLKEWLLKDDRVNSLIIYSNDTGVQLVFYRKTSDLIVTSSGNRIQKTDNTSQMLFQHEIRESLIIPNQTGIELKVTIDTVQSSDVFNQIIYFIILCLFLLFIALIFLPFLKDEEIQEEIIPDSAESTQVSATSLEDWVNHQLSLSYDLGQDLSLALISSNSGHNMQIKNGLERDESFHKYACRIYKVGQAVIALLIPGMNLDRAVKTFNPVLKQLDGKGGFTSVSGRSIHGITLIEEAKAALRKARNEDTTLYGFKVK
ncbi:hypothetical protein [Spirochaeta cellobiosiphila]|uniref:hypothetical protein n=1 Tax=Spirochaeta cellobiosiphila TaxID=504483 RepID=UPI000410058C|nr:hypothetical protein [Spirochaeta cellobiosiphila]